MNSLAFKYPQSSNLKALQYLILPVLLLLTGTYLSFSHFLPFYILSQCLLALFFFQCFILLHEAGHLSYFRQKWLNKTLGHFCSLISFIPLLSWMHIHHLHHRWTGYRDLDPTTENTDDPELTTIQRIVVNGSWRLWIPFFSLVYRAGNYWNPAKMRKHADPRRAKQAILNMLTLLFLYTLIFSFYGKTLLVHAGPAYLLSLMISDIFILSQHSHIRMLRAGSEKVKPLRFAEQLPFTRSLHIADAIAAYVFFNFNLHEQHHAQPGVPAYCLQDVKIQTHNTVKFLSFVKAAKALSGVNFVLRSSEKRLGTPVFKNKQAQE